MLMKTDAHSLTEQLAAHFAERIRNHLLVAGSRLPSVRQCAAQHQVSPSTVVAAYDRLLAEGLVEARKNRGFFIRETPSALMASARAATNSDASATLPQRQKPVNAAALMRGMFHGQNDRLQPGMGVFPPEWLANDFVAGALRRAAAQYSDQSFQYGDPAGSIELRRALSKKLAGIHLHVGPEQFITTVGATHGLDVVSRTLLRAGDYVMVEEPGWSVEFARLAALGARILPVPRGPEGPDLAVMERYCQAHQPKLFVSVSVLHNPTGHSISPGSAHRVLTLANAHNFYIAEDDTYSHLAPEHATRLCVLDGLQRTIYVSGFAKILAPGWRVGYIAAPQELVEPLMETKLLATLSTPSLLEHALAWCIDQGQLRRHAERVRTKLDQARTRSVKLALASGCTLASEPAGLFGWVDTGVDTDALLQRLLDQGYMIAPGALFHAERKPSTLMRINFAATQEPAFWQAFVLARDAMRAG
jgi:DNA-binding transcriptional MocR family regulator